MYIFGASGHAKVIIDLLDSTDRVQGIFDDDPGIPRLMEIPVRGPVPEDFIFDQPLFIAVGDNNHRKNLYLRFRERATFASIIHPSAIFSKRATLAAGTVVMESAIVKVDSCLGKQVIVNTGAAVDHECRLSDFVHIAPGAILCGGVEVGEGSLIGAGSTVLPGLHIGAWVKVGAGSVVTRNIPDGSTWIGNRLKGNI
ncbi:acetyltransferase [Cyclobacterium plantarum]|uniref:Acetyltransferase n=1 Tax=Cyclobacterium plantarum TaxID=2716263 RepID=A0ABX0HG04_9BACT|nr:acetyltransferase [Cyclobacterium plantarum]NHE59321.1 acetyltransferase [Cyclobacterium plantarum]